ncbi:MAG: hypothetical protein V4702_03565 [Patescibacteria group bacterium]
MLTSIIGVKASDVIFLAVILALFNLKYLLYDGLIVLGKHHIKKFVAQPWHLTGYYLAAVIDILSVYYAVFSGDTDAGFSVIILIFFTPWILVTSLILMVANTVFARKAK